MKPFLGIDLTTDKKNEQFNGTEFLVMKPSSAMAQSFEQSSKKAEETIERSKLPLPLRITQFICGGLGAISAVGIIKGLGTVSLNQAYKNAPWVFWLGGICLLIWGILKIISTLKEKAVLYMEINYHRKFNLSDMAGDLGLEYSYFFRLFKRNPDCFWCICFQESFFQDRHSIGIKKSDGLSRLIRRVVGQNLKTCLKQHAAVI